MRFRQRFVLDRTAPGCPAEQINRIVEGPFRGGSITSDIRASGDAAEVVATLRHDVHEGQGTQPEILPNRTLRLVPLPLTPAPQRRPQPDSEAGVLAYGSAMSPDVDRPLRIVQWTTGNLARQTVRAVLAHPGLERVGAFAHSPEPRGRRQ